MENQNALVVFQDKKIRRAWHENEWYFSVIDVVTALEASTIPKRYWSDLKIKLSEEGFEPYDKIVQLKLPAEDGKLRETDCSNTKSMFRIIQSIPSPKAEPFKRWLAQVGYERVQEIENPELSQERMKELYKAKGYSDEWIENGLNLRWFCGKINVTADLAVVCRALGRRIVGIAHGVNACFKPVVHCKSFLFHVIPG
ncbi:MAG: Bro-N domain-containing protein [Candidatus Diapherotrites archaeon]|nr:Bro-N domain-containing protein [Candidatus Diapherotrites archaeon]